MYLLIKDGEYRRETAEWKGIPAEGEEILALFPYEEAGNYAEKWSIDAEALEEARRFGYARYLLHQKPKRWRKCFWRDWKR